MKTTAFRNGLLAAAAVFAGACAAQDNGWDARMAALQEEHDAQAGVAVSIVFDDSGSMSERQKLTMAKQAFRAWIEHAPDNYRFGLEAINAGVLVRLQRNDRAQILAAVDRLVARGGTPLARTIAHAAQGIRQRQAAGAVYERQVVVILTDGEDTSDRGIAGVQEEIRGLRKQGVEVIAFGYQGEGDYMRDSATHFYSPENGQDISKGLNAIGSEIGDTSDVVVDDATRAIMKGAAPVHPSAEATAPPAPEPSAAPAQPAVVEAPTRGSRSWQWIIVIGGFMIFRMFIRRRLK